VELDIVISICSCGKRFEILKMNLPEMILIQFYTQFEHHLGDM